MVTTFFPPFSFGGDGILVERLARALVRRGHAVTVMHDAHAWRQLARAPDPPRPRWPEGLTVVTLDGALGRLSPLLVHQLGRQVVHGRRLATLVDGGGFDVVHTHNVSLVGGAGVFAPGPALRLHTAHDHWLVCPSHDLWRHGREPCSGRQCLRCVLAHGRPPQLWRATGGLARRLRHVDAFLALSEFSRAKHAEFGFPCPMEVVPPFVEAREAAPGHADHPRPYLLFVGRLERLKGLDRVIPVLERHPGADLVVAGDGREAAALRALAAGRRVRFLGRLSQEELDPWYRDALALFAPSLGFETFSLVLLEAFRHGTPVIARRRGPFPEIVGASGAGLLFESDDELLAALDEVQHAPGRRAELSRRALAAAAGPWAEETVLAQYLDVVRRAAERRGVTAPGR